MKQENNIPEWVKAARQWQNEDTDTRSIIIITSDKNGMANVADGLPLLIINSIFQNISQNPTVAQYIKDAQAIAKGGIAEYLFTEKFSEYANEHGIETKEGNPLERLHTILGNLLNKDNE